MNRLCYSLPIVGLPYHDAPTWERQHWEGLPIPARLRLTKEPNNPHDPNAVSVWMHDSSIPVKLGYLPQTLGLFRTLTSLDAVAWINPKTQQPIKEGVAWSATLIVDALWKERLEGVLKPKSLDPLMQHVLKAWTLYSLPLPNLFAQDTNGKPLIQKQTTKRYLLP